MEKLAGLLVSHDLPTWYAPKELLGGVYWHDEIGMALAQCDWFLVVLSPEAVRSRWVRHEVRYALIEPRFEGRIVPVLHKACPFRELSWTLASIQYVDFTAGFAKGSRDLLRVWGRDPGE